MSSFQESMVANKLRKYITAHGEEDVKNRCWKINAGPHGWGLLFDNHPHLKDADRKPKKFCEAQSAALSWLSDDNAPGKGYITVLEAAATKKPSSSTVVRQQPTPLMSAVAGALFHDALRDFTITNGSNMVHLSGRTSPKQEIISIEKKVIFD